jgi:hypothetical protein
VMKLRILHGTWTLALLLALPLVAPSAEQPKSTGSDEFFIVSSVDASKNQLVLKHPTEVTELMAVNDSTAYVDDQGHPLQFKDLRAGDTVYVTYSTRRDGPPVAVRIRRAPMTLEELHRRYLPNFG